MSNNGKDARLSVKVGSASDGEETGCALLTGGACIAGGVGSLLGSAYAWIAAGSVLLVYAWFCRPRRA